MIEECMEVTSLISEYIDDVKLEGNITDYMPEINVGDVFYVDEDTHKVTYYGSGNDILNSDEFKNWLKKKGDNNG